jgi:MFS family permease
LTPARASGYRELLALHDVRALLLATLFSRLAGRMFSLTIVLFALARTGSPMVAGWLAFAAVAPGLAVSPIAGALIDRVGSAWAITVDMAAGSCLVITILAVDWLDQTSPPVLLALVSLFSLTRPLSMAGIRALLPRLVPPASLDRVNALDTALNGIADIAGPALAGALFGFGGAMVTFATISAGCLAAAFSVAKLRGTRGRLPRAVPLLTDAWGGVLRVLRQPTLRGLAVCYSLYEVGWGILIVAVPVFAARQFAGGAGSAVAGLLWAGLGLVGGTAALVAGHCRTAGRERQVIAIGMLTTAVAAWPLAAEFGFSGLVLGLMLIGAAAGPIDVGVLTLRQRRTDPRELGRVLSVSISLNLSGGPIGSALAGVLVGRSYSGTFMVAAIAAALAATAVGLIPRYDDRPQ